MQPIELPAPYAGINQQIPVAALEHPFCENVVNFNPTFNGLELRNGDDLVYTVSRAGDDLLAYYLAPYGDSTLLGIVFNNTLSKEQIIDVQTNTLLFTGAFGAAQTFYQVYFNNRLFMFSIGIDAPGVYYDGTVAAAIGYTGTNFLPVGGNSHNERIYIIQSGEAAYWYGSIGQVTGALTKVDLSSVISEKAVLFVIGSVTLSETIQSVAYQAFIFSNGEVLFYQGSYPNSSDWGLVGRAKVGNILSINEKLSYQGDTYILTDDGVVSLRELFLKGAQGAVNLSVNTRVQNTWRTLVKKIRAATSTYSPASLSRINIVYDPEKSRIIIAFNYYLDSSGALQSGNLQFVFNTIFNSWAFMRSYGISQIYDIATFKNRVYFIDGAGTAVGVLLKEGGSNFLDDTFAAGNSIAYDYEIKSAPIKTARGYVQKGAGMDVIVNSDLHAQTNYQLSSDLGVTTTTAQKVNAVSGSLQNTFVNMGIEGSYIQYKISGTTATGKTVGYKLYGINYWTEQGRNPR